MHKIFTGPYRRTTEARYGIDNDKSSASEQKILRLTLVAVTLRTCPLGPDLGVNSINTNDIKDEIQKHIEHAAQ